LCFGKWFYFAAIFHCFSMSWFDCSYDLYHGFFLWLFSSCSDSLFVRISINLFLYSLCFALLFVSSGVLYFSVVTVMGLFLLWWTVVQLIWILVTSNRWSDARSYQGTNTASDHRLLVTRIQINWTTVHHNKNKPITVTTEKYNTPELTNNKAKQREYKNKLIEILTKRESEQLENNHRKNPWYRS
jgi:hypothetical protein